MSSNDNAESREFFTDEERDHFSGSIYCLGWHQLTQSQQWVVKGAIAASRDWTRPQPRFSERQLLEKMARTWLDIPMAQDYIYLSMEQVLRMLIASGAVTVREG